jgi:DNA modification methylase
MEVDLFGNEIIEDVLLRDKFIEPPFSVLDTKGGGWQTRKRLWKQLGIESHLGRDGVVVIRNDFEGDKYGRKSMPEVSIFDPALCELIYNWYCPKNGMILDPFSGGSANTLL